MESLDLELKKVWCFAYDYTEQYIDNTGRATGEKYAMYKQGQLVYGTISSATGSTTVDMFGKDIQYDKVVILSDTTTPIDEYTVFCIDKDPSYDEHGVVMYDYVVKRVYKTLNYTVIAVKKT
jgi:hypothetical protein